MKRTVHRGIALAAVTTALACLGGVPAAAPAPIEEALGAYEKARALLAADSTDGLAAAAKDMAAAARKAGAEPLAKAVDDLAGAADIAAARRAFGEVSRAVIALAAADPALAKGRHVFRCPMAEGYQKWVQTTPEIANPYMGKKMLKCGGKSDWK
jgi:Cu(I)/Ag(I) efflux system membrane fusion protein